jgi:hypothetical protein
MSTPLGYARWMCVDSKFLAKSSIGTVQEDDDMVLVDILRWCGCHKARLLCFADADMLNNFGIPNRFYRMRLPCPVGQNSACCRLTKGS